MIISNDIGAVTIYPEPELTEVQVSVSMTADIQADLSKIRLFNTSVGRTLNVRFDLFFH